MRLPKLKRILTRPDEFLSNGQLMSLSMELLELVPMKGIEGPSLDSEQLIEVVLRAAVDAISVNGVTTNTEDTPNREPVMDWLQTLENEPMLDAVNDILALVAMTVLDRERLRTICIDLMDNTSHCFPTMKMSSVECQHGWNHEVPRYCTAFALHRRNH